MGIFKTRSYEVQTDANLVLNTTELTVEATCQRILHHLQGEGFLPLDALAPDPWNQSEALARSGRSEPASAL